MVSPSKAKAAASRPTSPTGAPRAHKQVDGHPSPKAPKERPVEAQVGTIPVMPAMAPDPAAERMAPLEALAKDPLKVIALLLWKARYRNPDFAVQITPEDLMGLEACTNYLEVSPTVLIGRPRGAPAHPGLPKGHPRYPEGLPARPEDAPKPYLQVGMVDAKTGDAFVPIENSEEGARMRDKENMLRDLRARAPLLAQSVAANAASNQFSQSEITDLCNAVIQLARST